MNDATPPRPTPEPPSTVKVIFASERDHGYAALVEVCGEHDMATADDIGLALRGLHGSVLVDLSECSFIDSTVVGVLVADLRARRLEGHRLNLVVPPANARITRTIKVMGVGELLEVHASLPPPR